MYTLRVVEVPEQSEAIPAQPEATPMQYEDTLVQSETAMTSIQKSDKLIEDIDCFCCSSTSTISQPTDSNILTRTAQLQYW